jgi:CheY-like chemotaxis protein
MQAEQALPVVIKVLLVEDNDGDARLIQELLKEETDPGVTCHVTRAAKLSDALAQLDRARFDVILLDLWLADSIGVQTVIRIRLRPNDTPIVVLTGNTDQHIGVEAINAGAQDFFVKGRVDAPLLAKALLRQTNPGRGQGRPASPISVRVLLVEDNPGDARLLRELLSREPIPGVTFDVTGAARLSDALERLEDAHFDAILLDLWLPDSDGVQTVTRVRLGHGDTPVIVITGNTDEHVRFDALRAGAQDFLAKGGLDAQSLANVLLRHARHERAA